MLNLLKNPNGDEGLDYWQLTENGGFGWQVEEMPREGEHAFNNSAVTKYFSTSYELNLKKQVIDLVAEGYNPDDLDNQPAVTIEDWFCCRTDCGCMYQIAVSLLDANSQPLQEYKPDVVILDPDSDGCSWRKVTNTFTGYGPGLRYISFEHGGNDIKYWEGWFGARVTGSSVTINL
ncbi:F-box only protein 2-like [Clarias gariepinus]|uniref:F-box only protein 2-like n=1 Tax=Clarias gariepinus TaxID=13013 RepID=UPI00234C884C|nr:F-box only protein 2-like [Clarias gariepinus]